jgi:hypothetical protein
VGARPPGSALDPWARGREARYLRVGTDFAHDRAVTTISPYLRAALFGAGLLLAACEVGPDVAGGDDVAEPDAGVDAAPASYSLTVTPTATTQLGTVTMLTVDLSSSHFTGPVALTASGAPASWQVAITPSSVDLTDGQTTTATVKITIPSNGDGAPTGQALTITGTGDPGTRTAMSSVTVENVYVLGIGTPGAGGQHFSGMAGGQIRMKQGAKLRIPNTDAVPHRVHSDGGVPGFPHQPASMAAGAAYEVTLGATGTDTFYCHDHGQGTGIVRLTVE